MKTEKLIRDFYNSFEWRKRPNGEEYVGRYMKNKSYNKLFREIHGTEIMPDDFRYKTIYYILENLFEYSVDWKEIINSNTLREAFEDHGHEIIDGLVPIYNTERTNWLDSSITRASYVDEAREQGLIANDTPLIEQIGCGIYVEIQELYNNIISALGEYIEED